MHVLDPFQRDRDVAVGGWLAPHEIAEPEDCAQRRPKLVAHRREEVALRLAGGVQLFYRGAQPGSELLLVRDDHAALGDDRGLCPKGDQELPIGIGKQGSVPRHEDQERTQRIVAELQDGEMGARVGFWVDPGQQGFQPAFDRHLLSSLCNHPQPIQVGRRQPGRS